MARPPGPEAYWTDGKKIARRKLEMGWTKSALSMKAGISPHTLNTALGGQRKTLGVIRALAGALRVSNWLELVNLDLEPELASTVANATPPTDATP